MRHVQVNAPYLSIALIDHQDLLGRVDELGLLMSPIR